MGRQGNNRRTRPEAHAHPHPNRKRETNVTGGHKWTRVAISGIASGLAPKIGEALAEGARPLILSAIRAGITTATAFLATLATAWGGLWDWLSALWSKL